MRDNFISVFQIKSTVGDSDKCAFKVIVFHCLDAEHQNQMVKSTQYCVVGNYLCYRHRNKKVVWITELKQDFDAPIPVNSYEDDILETMFTKYQSKLLGISNMLERNDLEHIQMTDVPKSYFTTIKDRTGKKLEFYNNLLQITVQSHGMIFNLDTVKEIDSIESIDQLQDPDTMVNTGFIMSTSTNDIWEGEKFLRRI